MSADGVWHRCHPILVAFVGDYPEHFLVTCTYSGCCPKCTVPRDQLGNFIKFPLQDCDRALDIYELADGDTMQFYATCLTAGLKPVQRPFWEFLPLSNIFLSITLDILHQLLQGVMKHILSWVANSCVFGLEEINARCCRLPPNHNIMIFTKGITTLSHVSGLEHKKICCILLGLVVNLPLPGGQSPIYIIQAIWALLDFLYLAQYQTHTADTLSCLDDALSQFHDNKDIFINLGARTQFKFPKLHSLIHYVSSIKLFSTMDNYNTEQSKRLHIDFTKDAYCTTNHKDEYPQMTAWLECHKKIWCHTAHIQLEQGSNQAYTGRCIEKPMGPPLACTYLIKMTQHPSISGIDYNNLMSKYGANEFQDTLGDFIAAHKSTMGSVVTI